MLCDRLGLKAVPQNIFKLTKDDEESTSKLRLMVQQQTIAKQQAPYQQSSLSPISSARRSSNSFIGGGFQVESPAPDHPERKVEIRLGKNKQQSSLSPLTGRGQKTKDSPMIEETKSSSASSPLGSTNNNNANQKIQTLKDLFDKYEIAVVNAETVTYQSSQKSVMLCFNLVSEHKAKNQLLYVNSQAVQKTLVQFNKRLQQLYYQAERGPTEDSINGTSQQQSVIEFLGTTYLLLNKIQQIMHEFQEESLAQHNAGPGQAGTPVTSGEETFLLKEEIL